MGTESITPESGPIGARAIFGVVAHAVAKELPAPERMEVHRLTSTVVVFMPNEEPELAFRWARTFKLSEPKVRALFTGKEARGDGRPWCVFETEPGAVADTGWRLQVKCYADVEHKTVAGQCAVLAERENAEREAALTAEQVMTGAGQ
jgi:hypothetical protein